MLYINKSHAPALFAEIRRKIDDYDSLHEDEKKPLKKILIDEQGALCAYCMSRIGEENSTIEHYVPRHGLHGDMSLSLEYSNLFAVCKRTRNEKAKNKTCDDRRGDKPLTIDPRKKSDIEKIRYRMDGTICSENPDIEKDLNDTLNLNVVVLKNNRKAAMETAMRQLQKQKSGHWNREYLEKMLNKFSTDNPKIEYAGAIIYLLKKRLGHE